MSDNHPELQSKIENNTLPSDDSNNETLNNRIERNMQRRLKGAWMIWLIYRSFAFPILLGVLLTTKPDVVGGIAWQMMLLIPALILTPWMIKGKSPYALLMGSMVTLIYFGASGVKLFALFYSSSISLWWVYAIDTLLLLFINVWLFKLLKVLPSMNKAVNNLNK